VIFFGGRLIYRIGAILLLSFGAMILLSALTLNIDRNAQADRPNLWPTTDQIVALVGLIERHPLDRPALLNAANSPEIRFRITEQFAAPAGSRPLSAIARAVRDALSSEPARIVEAHGRIEGSTFAQWQWLQFYNAPDAAFLLAVGLQEGGFLIVETRGDLGRKLFGVPPGFLVGLTGALLGFMAIVGVFLETRPLLRLTAAVRAFAETAVPQCLPSNGASDVRELTAAIRDMQSRIADLLRERTLLIGAVSHDLRTYITRLRLRAELMDDSHPKDAVVRDLDEMAELIDQAIAVARNEGEVRSDARVDVTALMDELIEARNDARLVWQRPSAGCLVLGDPLALKRAIDNVVSNALRYANGGHVRLGSANGWVHIVVDDAGVGIPPDERRRVLEPFYRIDSSRSRATAGAGLGLSITHQVTIRHGGRLELDRSPLGGLRVTISLPAAPGDRYI
jgi:two-component system osmolarity sensor histidine kinase EnvZ